MIGGIAGYGARQADMAFGEPAEAEHLPTATTARDLTPDDVATQLTQLGPGE